MDSSREQIIRARDAFEPFRSHLIRCLLQLLDFTDAQALSAAYARLVRLWCGSALADETGCPTDQLDDFIDSAAEQTAYWIVDKVLSGVPVVAIVPISVYVFRHKLLTQFEYDLGVAERGNFAMRLTELIARLALVQDALLVRVRFTARRARKGMYTPPHPRDVETISQTIIEVLPELSDHAREIAASALERVCLWILSLGAERYTPGEFLITKLPSKFIAEATTYRFRHELLSAVEDVFSNG